MQWDIGVNRCYMLSCHLSSIYSFLPQHVPLTALSSCGQCFSGERRRLLRSQISQDSKGQIGSPHIPILSILEIKKVQCAVSLANTSTNVENNIEHIHTYTQEQMGALLFITLSCPANLHFLNKATYRYCSCNFSLWNISI